MISDADFKKGKFWTDAWSLIDGCTPVSPGCRNCWLKAIQERFGYAQGNFKGNVKHRIDRIEIPIHRKRPSVYAIWSDLYHPSVPLSFITRAFEVMDSGKCRHHTFLIITKRPEIAAEYCEQVSALSGGISLPDNVIHIATMEDQKHVDKRMSSLLRIPGKRGVIIEPMLGPVLIDGATDYSTEENQGDVRPWLDDIHQVILGPENGASKRPFKEEWAESVKSQCEGAGVPFYRKDKGKGELIWR